MKSLTEIKRNITSFYSSIQSKVTDFSIGSVVGGLFYSFSASLERAYTEIDEVRDQAYTATATGEYLDRLIDGTFRLKRTPATRSVGYVVIYSNSPLPNPSSVALKYAEFNYETGEFVSGLQSSTKFIGYNEQGEDGIVYALINTKNVDSIDIANKLMIIDRNVQYLILPVASVISGSDSRVREGGIYSFPSPPAGLTGVLNTSNPGKVFFSSQQSISGSPFYSRFTEILGYNETTSSFSVINAYNFSPVGFLEITGNISQSKPLVANYTQNQDGTGILRQSGLLLEYIEASTFNITLNLPLENSQDKITGVTILFENEVINLPLHSFTYDGVTYTNPYDGSFDTTISQFVVDNLSDGLRIKQRPDQISDALIFDPDTVLTTSYELIDSATISGGTDIATDAEYREALRKYLASLSRATRPALEAGALQIPGVTFARTLPATMSPRGSAIVLASDDTGVLSSGLRRTIKDSLNNEWKAAGINIVVRPPTLIKVHTTMSIVLEPGIFQSSITQKINPTLEAYFSAKEPGDSLKYSEILDELSSIVGVSNIYNLILSKELTSETYETYKSGYKFGYDFNLLLAASSGGFVNTIAADPNSNNLENVSIGGPINRVEVGGTVYIVKAYDVPTADGILYSKAGTYPEVFIGDPTTLYDLYQGLIVDTTATTHERFRELALDSFSEFGTESEAMYKLSYLLSEPLVPMSAENYPLDPLLISYSNIRDYNSEFVEIFRQNKFVVGTRSLPVVGINYL